MFSGKNAGRLSLQWGGKQQNPDILRSLLFWSAVLAGEHRSIKILTGGKPLVIDSLAATARMQRGIAFDTIRMRALLEQADNSLNEAAEGQDIEDESAEDTDETDGE